MSRLEYWINITLSCAIILFVIVAIVILLAITLRVLGLLGGI